MALVEVVMATGIFLAAGACSLQLWASSARASHQLGEEKRVLLQMDGQLLRLRAHWLQAASMPLATLGCQAASEWMAQDPAVLAPPAGMNQSLGRLADGQGVSVALRHEAAQLERRRVFAPAALGLCDAKGAG
jgi:hypothetical protein